MTSSREAGSATVFMLVAMGLVAAATAVVCCIGAATTVRHRAASAADAAALAAAIHSTDGQPAACTVAARLARADGGRLVTCPLSGPVAAVEVSIAPGGWLRALGAATVKAMAGPGQASEAPTKVQNLGHPKGAS